MEVDACIEGSLAAESSLVVLDTMELLMQTISARENLHSTLGRVGLVNTIKNHNHFSYFRQLTPIGCILCMVCVEYWLLHATISSCVYW